jgi:hypothetical protein
MVFKMINMYLNAFDDVLTPSYFDKRSPNLEVETDVCYKLMIIIFHYHFDVPSKCDSSAR